MKLIVRPGNGLVGEINLPGDKSISLRAALFATLADGESRIDHFLMSGITKTMLSALSELGVKWSMEDNCLVVEGKGRAGLRAPASPISCGNSATTMRLLSGALAAAGIPAVLDGSPSLRRRPMQRLIEPLRTMGIDIHATNGTAPLILAGRIPRNNSDPICIQLSVASAQVKTSVLLAALASSGEVYIEEPSLSRDHSERMLQQMGINIERIAGANSSSVCKIRNAERMLRPLKVRVPGDFSAAAFFIIAGLIIPGSRLILRDVGLNPTRTGLLDALQEMGANISIKNLHNESGEPVGDIILRSSQLQGIEIAGSRVVQMIDEFPIFSIAAAMSRGKTTVSHAQELRYKESDRIAVLCANLNRLDIQTRETQDGFIVDGNGEITGGIAIDPLVDHRIAMAFTVAGLAAHQPLQIDNAEIISESFPEFSSTLRSLGAIIDERT